MEKEVTVGSTQVTYPWKAAMRTLLAFAVPTLIALATALNIISDSYSEMLPKEAVLWITAAAGVLLTTATVITRIMAIPFVDNALSYIGLGSTPKDIQTVHAPANADVYVETPKVPAVSLMKFKDDVVVAEKTLDTLPTKTGRHVLNLEEGK